MIGIPDSLVEKAIDSTVDAVSEQLSKIPSIGVRASRTLQKLHSEDEFRSRFRQTLSDSLADFIREYRDTDKELADLLESNESFLLDDSVQRVLLAILKRPDRYLQKEREAVQQRFLSVFPQIEPHERVEDAINALLRVFAQSVWLMPEFSGIYTLLFQKATADALQEQLAISRAQLQATLSISDNLRTSLLQLTDAVASSKLIETSNSPLELVDPGHTATNSADSSTDSTMRVDFLPENFPANYVERTIELAELRNRLVTDRTEGILAKVIVLHGKGGSGKTALARAVCQDPNIRERYKDGILWAKIGKETDFSFHQRNWIGALGGVIDQASTFEAGRAILRKLLAEKSFLIVLDDVWTEEAIQAFQIADGNSSILITTRDLSVVPDGHIIPVGQMSAIESRQLLTKCSRGLIDDGEIPGIAARLGYLPLAMKVVGAMLARRVLWADIVDALDEGEIDFVSYGASNVITAISTSVNYLPDDKRQRYYELCVFPSDEVIPENAVVRLWTKTAGLKPREARKLLVEFCDRALLEDDYRLHDLQHDYLQHIVTPDKQRELHSLIATNYSEIADGRIVPLEKSNGYGWRRLIFHLSRADRQDDIVDLLTDYVYLHEKIRRLGTAALLADFGYLQHHQLLDEIESAIRRSADVLNRSPNELRNEIVGRTDKLGMFYNVDPDRVSSIELLSQSLTPAIPPPIGSIEGHIGAIISCDCIDEEGIIATSSTDASIRIWRRDTRQTVSVLVGHTNHVRCCRFLGKAGLLLSASRDSTVRLWDTVANECIRQYQGHTDSVEDLAISPDGNWFVSASADTHLKIWEIDTSKSRLTLRGHVGSVRCCSIHPEGGMIASGSDDTFIKIWDSSSGELLHEFRAHEETILSCGFSHDGEYLLTSSADRTVKLWSVGAWSLKKSLIGHQGPVSDCDISADNSYVVSASWDRRVFLWDVNSGDVIQEIGTHRGAVSCCRFAFGDSLILSGGWDCTLVLSIVAKGKPEAIFEGVRNYVRDCAFDHTGGLAIIASDDKTLRVYDVSSRGVNLVIKGHEDSVRTCSFHPSGQSIASGSEDNTVRIWNAFDGRVISVLNGHKHYVRSCSFDATGSFLLSGSWDKSLILWNPATGEKINQYWGHEGVVNCCSFHPNGERFASGSWDTTVRIWSTTQQEPVMILRGHTSHIRDCCYSHDGSMILSASNDSTLRLWNSDTGDLGFILGGHSDPVRNCAFSYDDRYCISVSDDSTLVLWSVSNGKMLSRWFGDGPLTCCEFSPNDYSFIVGDSLGKLHFLNYAIQTSRIT